jgi:hypothetical protein
VVPVSEDGAELRLRTVSVVKPARSVLMRHSMGVIGPGGKAGLSFKKDGKGGISVSLFLSSH